MEIGVTCEAAAAIHPGDHRTPPRPSRVGVEDRSNEAIIAQAQRERPPHEPFRPRDEGPEAGPGVAAAVVVHGFTGAPWDVLPVAEGLGEAGVHAHVPLLTGHDRGPEGVAQATLADWRADVAEAARRLHRVTERPVLLVGLSMGGLLALDAAIRDVVPIAGLAILAAPLELPRSGRVGARAARLMAELRGRQAAEALILEKKGGSDISNGLEMPGPDGIPLLALGELIGLMDLVLARLEAVSAPLLVLHAQQDHTAPIEGAWELHKRAQSTRSRLVVLDEGYHILPRDVSRARVVSEVVSWAGRL